MVTLGDKIEFEKKQWIVSSVLPEKSLIYVEQEKARNQGLGKWLLVLDDGFVPYDITSGAPLIQLPVSHVEE